MTKPKIVALLSVLALLASLPLTVALAQGAPYLVIGSAMLDGEPAMMGTMVVAMVGEHKVGEGEVFDDQGRYRLQINQGNVGDTVTISLMMGEGEEAMEYMTMTEEDVMVGLSGDRNIAHLMAYSGEPPDPTATPGPTLTAAQQQDAMRGPSGRQGFQGIQGELAPLVLTAPPAPLVWTALTALTAQGLPAPQAPLVWTARTALRALTALTAPTALTALPDPQAQTAEPEPPVLTERTEPPETAE